MYILVNRNNVVVYISTQAILKTDGIHVGSDLVFSDKTLEIIYADVVPDNIIPQKYCYEKDKEFYLNEAYQPVNTDGGSINEKVDYILNKIEPVIDENRLSLEDMIKLQVKRVGVACSEYIYAGIDVELSTGVEHFSLTLQDQSNIDKLGGMISKGMKFAPYHSDLNGCKIYSAEDAAKIAYEKDVFVLSQLTYCNHLNTWIRRCTTKEEIKQIYFGAELPEDLKENFNTIMQLSLEELNRLTQS